MKISLNQLKRILTKRGLRQRGRQSPLEDIISGIEHELKGNGIGIGYMSMWQSYVKIMNSLSLGRMFAVLLTPEV
jgi:hypothetical protein